MSDCMLADNLFISKVCLAFADSAANSCVLVCAAQQSVCRCLLQGHQQAELLGTRARGQH